MNPETAAEIARIEASVRSLPSTEAKRRFIDAERAAAVRKRADLQAEIEALDNRLGLAQDLRKHVVGANALLGRIIEDWERHQCMSPETALDLRDLLVAWSRICASDMPFEPSEAAETVREMREELNEKLPVMFEAARVVIWRNDLWAASGRGYEVFVGQPMDWHTRIAPSLWLLNGIGLSFPTGDPTAGLTLAILVYPRPKHLGLIDVLLTDERGMRLDNFRVIDAGEPMDEPTARVCAAARFIEMEFVGQERQTLPRWLRRKAELGRRPPLPEIRVIQLRRSYREEKPPNGDGEAREWSCSWLVSGHWRQQACGPFHSERKAVYVQGYVKGDTSKPLRVPKGTVYKVSR